MAEELYREIKEMNNSDIEKVRQFIRFLKFENANNITKKTKKKRRVGIFEGGLNYISDDFDETPECFKEYVWTT